MPKTTVEILDTEFEVVFDFNITSHASPETGPSYASGGEPATACEFEVEILDVRFPKQAESLELPNWLKSVLAGHLENDDAVITLVRDADGDEPDFDPHED